MTAAHLGSVSLALSQVWWQENTLSGCWELSLETAGKAVWQRIWVGAGGLRGQGARTPEMERMTKSSCTWPLQKAGGRASDWERPAAAEQGSHLSLVLSLYLEGLCLRPKRGTYTQVTENWPLAIKKLYKCKTKNLRSWSKKLTKNFFKKAWQPRTLCAHCCCPLFSFLNQVLQYDNTQGLFYWPAVSCLNPFLSWYCCYKKFSIIPTCNFKKMLILK